MFQELKYLHPSVHVHIISTLFKRHPNLHADVSWDVLAKQIFMNYDGKKNASHLHHDVHPDFDKEVKGSIVDTKQVAELRKELHEQFKVHEALVKTHGSVTGTLKGSPENLYTFTLRPTIEKVFIILGTAPF